MQTGQHGEMRITEIDQHIPALGERICMLWQLFVRTHIELEEV